MAPNFNQYQNHGTQNHEKHEVTSRGRFPVIQNVLNMVIPGYLVAKYLYSPSGAVFYTSNFELFGDDDGEDASLVLHSKDDFCVIGDVCK